MKKDIVLVIEDEIYLRRLIRNKLINSGFVVLEAENGKDGLEMTKKEHPDVILLDILMPVMDGLMMLKELRQDEYGKKVPVIILSNLEKTNDITKTLDKDAKDYFMKSDIDPDGIVNIVKKRLSETQ